MLDLALAVASSPVIYLVVLGLAAGDAVFPVLPAESVVIALGVFAADGNVSLTLLVVAAAVGATAGDHTAYAIGRRAGPAVRRRYLDGKRARELTDRLEHMVHARGGTAVLVGRYIPGGRTATCMLAGTMRLPLRTFTTFDLLACVSWALYAGLLGYWGGRTFDNTWVALGVAGAVAVALFLVSEALRWWWRRRLAEG